MNRSKKEVEDNIKKYTEELAAYVQENVKPGRRRSHAITQLEDFSMWAVKANYIEE